MINITEEQKCILNKYIPMKDIDTIKSDVNELLFLIDDVILDVGLDKDDEINKDGLILQRLYDQIYNQNK